MKSAKETLDDTFHEMRWRVLSLAADFDRIGRGEAGETVLNQDNRLAKLREAMAVVSGTSPHRAETVQQIFSDKTAPPSK